MTEDNFMFHKANLSHNWFDAGGKEYAHFRPQYPPELASYLTSLAPNRVLAVDVGCGTGQLTRLLAEHFKAVLGLDPSADQLAHAKLHPAAHYLCAAAEQLPVAGQCVQLITAAQAAHWFDLPRFYQEVRRIAAPDALLALISYGVLHLDAALNERFNHFYWQEINPFWPPERSLVESGYAELAFPFQELKAPDFIIRKQLDLQHILGYIATWSAVRKLQEAGKDALLQGFAADLAELWGNPVRCKEVSWPIKMRLGRV